MPISGRAEVMLCCETSVTSEDEWLCLIVIEDVIVDLFNN
jgi:hypothetical protein